MNSGFDEPVQMNASFSRHEREEDVEPLLARSLSADPQASQFESLQVQANNGSKNDSVDQKSRFWLSTNTWKLLFLGQVISAIECATGVFNTLLQRRGVDIPCTQNAGMYLLLTLVYVPILVRRGEFLKSLKRNGHKFFALALIDVEANFTIVTAYQYTNFTSVQLIDCSNLGFVVLLSRIFLKTQYTRWHLLGVFICLVGNSGVISADWIAASKDEDSVGSDPILGDVLVVLAAFMYACSNVGEEYYVRALDSTHFLGFVGLFGTIISVVQGLVLERRHVVSMEWSEEVVGLLVGYTVILFCMYSLVPVLISRGGAVLFNLSLLTADVYSFIIGYIAFKIQFSWLYFPAFAVVLVGILLYTRAPEGRRPISAQDSRKLVSVAQRAW